MKVYSKNTFLLNKRSGFSLIELSVVLIIIGLLVTTITSGTSLINTAKIKSRINDFEKIKTSFHIFWSTRGKYPGDVNNDGNIGTCDGTGCILSIESTSKNFGGEYINKTVSHQVGPWIDLYLENLSDFKPNPQGNLSTTDWRCSGVGIVYPYFKKISNTCLREFRTFREHNGINGIYVNLYSIDLNKGVSSIIFKQIDEKVDDGIYNTGNVFTDCSNYDSKKCLEMFYRITD